MRVLLLLALALSGCSLFGGDPAEVGFVVEVPAGLTAEATLRGRAVSLSDAQPTTASARRLSEATDTEAGPATVACTLASAAGATTGTLALELEAGWAYRVDCAAAATDPIGACFGCRGSASVPLDPALGLPADHRLFLVWSGDPIGRPVIY